MPFVQLRWQSAWNGGYLAWPDGTRAFLKKGDIHRFLWPDGHESTEQIQMQRKNGVDSDMGHEYHWTKDVPVIAIASHGVPAQIPVTALQIWVGDEK